MLSKVLLKNRYFRDGLSLLTAFSVESSGKTPRVQYTRSYETDFPKVTVQKWSTGLEWRVGSRSYIKHCALRAWHGVCLRSHQYLSALHRIAPEGEEEDAASGVFASPVWSKLKSGWEKWVWYVCGNTGRAWCTFPKVAASVNLYSGFLKQHI